MVFVIVSLIISIDQITKFLVTRNLFYNQSVPVIKGVFYLTRIHNRGAAFGILRNQVPLFIITSLLAVTLIYFNLKEHSQKKSYRIALSLILAGALGNLIDRAFLGYVIDFLDFRVWPVFNVADSAITVGAIVLGWLLLRSEKKAEVKAQG